MTPKLTDTSAIIVHHKNFPDVLETINALLRCGLMPQNLLVVDNSEDEEIKEKLSSVVGTDFNVSFTSNKGYANAVNEGIAWLSHHDALRSMVLVATHEVRPRPNAILKLRECLLQSSSAYVAGPTLVSDSGEGECVWSIGGYVDRFLNLPRHYKVAGKDIELIAAQAPALRDWLDGAFCLYRSDHLLQLPMCEDYFLYVEEADYHARLRELGGEVVWCPNAIVKQSTKGIPPYYLGRNLQIYQNNHGNRPQRFFTVPVILGHRMTEVIRGRLGVSSIRAMIRGWIDAPR